MVGELEIDGILDGKPDLIQKAAGCVLRGGSCVLGGHHDKANLPTASCRTERQPELEMPLISFKLLACAVNVFGLLTVVC